MVGFKTQKNEQVEVSGGSFESTSLVENENHQVFLLFFFKKVSQSHFLSFFLLKPLPQIITQLQQSSQRIYGRKARTDGTSSPSPLFVWHNISGVPCVLYGAGCLDDAGTKNDNILFDSLNR